MNTPYLSICIPTNGNFVYVSKVLDSIILENCSQDLYEVIITDNGNDNDFSKKFFEKYAEYSNFRYFKTDAQGFLNQNEAYTKSSGFLIKFVNHRMTFREGTLGYLIEFSKNNYQTKPPVYFSNGNLKLKKEITKYTKFDSFIKNLSYWSSWSAGLAIWKEDLIQHNPVTKPNSMFPHTDLLFMCKNKDDYRICDKKLLDELPRNWAMNGTYDFFDTFAVKYLDIIKELLDLGSISRETFISIKNDNLKFLYERYLFYVVLKKKSSYDFSTFNTSVSIYYSIKDFKISIYKITKILFNKIVSKVGRG